MLNELTPPKITMLYAGILGLLYFALSINVVRWRWKEKKGLGHENDFKSGLFREIRIHGNFAEYIPVLILMMALDEMTGRNQTFLHIIGGALVVGRIGHHFGITKTSTASLGRALGVFSSFGSLLI